MAESLRARVGRIIAGSAHALLDRLEDEAPEAMMEQAIREVEDVVEAVRGELGTATANRHLAQQHHAELNRKHADLAASVETAVAQSRDDLARAAVARQLDIEAQLPVLEATLADLAQQEGELKGYVDALLGKKREMQDAVEAFRASRAKTESAAAGPGGGAATRGKLEDATASFDRLYARHTGMNPSLGSSSAEHATKLKELDDLVRSNKIEERLAQIKASKSN